MPDAEHPEDRWVQVNLTTTPYPLPPALYGGIAELARELLRGPADEFFFMHKPPGLRLRFQARQLDDVPGLRSEVLKRAGEFGDAVATVYEPEVYLFGGDASMPYVHRLFTADALAWLDCHRAAATGQAPAGWRVSLLLLRELLGGLGIVGWEHRGVWGVVRSETGRALKPGHGDSGRLRAEQGIREWWERPKEGALDTLPQEWRARIAAHGDAVRRAADAWRTGYFEAGQAVRGPRRAAAYAVIFHWNRAALPAARQSLLTEALASDGVV
ncbi:thiopeptide-type bacteriocin biosynthesis protein [Streptomyces sp. NPDC003691]